MIIPDKYTEFSLVEAKLESILVMSNDDKETASISFKRNKSCVVGNLTLTNFSNTNNKITSTAKEILLLVLQDNTKSLTKEEAEKYIIENIKLIIN